MKTLIPLKWSVCLLALTLLFTAQPKQDIYADGANITFGTQSEITDDRVNLQVGGRLPADIVRFEININYNKEAFIFNGGSGKTYGSMAIKVTKISEGIVRISGSGGSIPAGDRLLATLDLQAKSAGVATLVLTNSNFFDASGASIPGTVLRYCTLNMQDSMPNVTTSTARTTQSIPETSATTVSGNTSAEVTASSENSESTGSSTTINSSQEETEVSSNESVTSEATQKPSESSIITSAISDTTSSAEHIKRDNFLDDPNAPIIIGIGMVLLSIAMIIATIVSSKKKRSKRARRKK